MSSMAPGATGATVEVGQVVEGTVTGITHFGAFVALPNGKTGLVHISEVADTYVRDINDFLHEQDPVRVKVLSMDDRGKVALSIRQANPNAASGPRSGSGGGGGRRPRSGGGRGGAPSFEDKLSRFMKDSESRLSDLRKSNDSKRGGRGS